MKHICIVGGGFTGLAAALDLSSAGYKVTVIEKDEQVGGLASSFRVGDQMLEKFYHHWYTNDRHIIEIVKHLGLEDQVLLRKTRTGMYYAKNFFKLSSPSDLLRFTPLSIFNRFRLGISILMARRVTDWRQLESLTAEEWLLGLCGTKIYDIVWKPLLIGKFGELASEISAVWMWNKLKLRGGSRSKDGAEELAYFRGGFAALAEQMADSAERNGAKFHLNATAKSLEANNGSVVAVTTSTERIEADVFLLTNPLPLAADLLHDCVTKEYEAQLRRIRYLSNVCLVLILDRSLSSTYWLNINDPSFPFVAIIEHTNFEPPATYDGKHIIYLSRYLTETAEIFLMNNEEFFAFSVKAIQRMFPDFSADWVKEYHVWRANFSQPIIEKNYSSMVPSMQTPIDNVFISTMSQVYPEDRGTNYAVRGGLLASKLIQTKDNTRIV
jgi:protoporphyrinogen oxidase